MPTSLFSCHVLEFDSSHTSQAHSVRSRWIGTLLSLSLASQVSSLRTSPRSEVDLRQESE